MKFPETLTYNHPVLGKVERAEEVKAPWSNPHSTRRAYTVGLRYHVVSPEGRRFWVTKSEWDQEVYRLAPKDVHMRQPEIKVGDFVEATPELSGGRWYWVGTVVKVTRSTFTVQWLEHKSLTSAKLPKTEVVDSVTLVPDRAKMIADMDKGPGPSQDFA